MAVVLLARAAEPPRHVTALQEQRHAAPVAPIAERDADELTAASADDAEAHPPRLTELAERHVVQAGAHGTVLGEDRERCPLAGGLQLARAQIEISARVQGNAMLPALPAQIQGDVQGDGPVERFLEHA